MNISFHSGLIVISFDDVLPFSVSKSSISFFKVIPNFYSFWCFWKWVCFLNLTLWIFVFSDLRLKLFCSYKILSWEFDKNCVKPIDGFGENGHLYGADPSGPQTQHVPPFTVVLGFFHHCFVVFSTHILYVISQLYTWEFPFFEQL